MISIILLTFQLPYTFGTHTGTIDPNQISNTLKVNTEKLTVSGKIHIGIQSIQMDGNKLKCHTLESLGLNYEISDFPKSHVCKKNQLPTSGLNKIEYPDIVFKPEKFSKKDKNTYEISGVFHIRNQTIKRSISFIHKENDTFTADWSFSLKELGIQVKPFLFVKVKDTVSLHIETKIIPNRGVI